MNLKKITWTFYLLSLLGLIALLPSCEHQPAPVGVEVVLPFEGMDSAQVEAVLAGLSLEEKIGQLVFWQPDFNDSLARNKMFESTLAGRAGGLLLKDLSLHDFLYAADSLRRNVKLPLFFGTTEKVSLHNQFTHLPQFPLPVSVAAIDSAALHLQLERQFLQQCKALGINFALNPTLQKDDPDAQQFDYQAFESDEMAMSERARRMAQQLQRNRILAVASHFGDFVFEPNDSLRESRLHSFLQQTRAGLTGLMVANGAFKADTLKHAPGNFIKNYLHTVLDFNGLMVVELGDRESPDRKLFEGAHLFITKNADRTFDALLKLVAGGKFSEADLDQRVRQVLASKAWIHGGRLPVEMTVLPIDSAKQQPVKLVSISRKSPPKIICRSIPRSADFIERAEEIQCYFEDPGWGFFIDEIFEKSVVLARDEQGLLPFKNIYDLDFQVFTYGPEPFHHFKNFFFKYADFTAGHEAIPPSGELKPVKNEAIGDSSVVVILLDSVDVQPGFHQSFIERVKLLSLQTRVVVINFGNPKNLRYFDPSVSCIQVFERNPATEIFAAQLLFGGVSPQGRLPLAVSPSLPFGASVRNPVSRLGFAASEKTGIVHERLVSINAIAETAIDNGVFPGCQIVVAKDGKVIYSQAFGQHTYDKRKKTPVRTTDLYDIASVTKVAATTLGVMRLSEEGKIDLRKPLGEYLRLDPTATVRNIKIKDLLVHNSGLQPQMPLTKLYSYKNVPARGCNSYFCRSGHSNYDIKVADGLYLRNDYQDTILKRVYRLPVSRPRFRYSDVNYFLLQQLVEDQFNTKLDRFVFENFYRKLGLRRTMFNPMEKFSKSEIVPTETDRYWRKTLVHGYVHDPAAALMGGVGGNAGVFSNAEDLAVLFQMLLNGGTYGGVRFFEPATIEDFTDAKYGNHRGLGFDKPANRRYPTYSGQASPESFGHTGFTGTCVWVDPEENLVYIFLANRIHPSARNGKIFTEATRSRIHEVVYDALGTFRPELPELAGEMIEEE